jgi:hypothetical protein
VRLYQNLTDGAITDSLFQRVSATLPFEIKRGDSSQVPIQIHTDGVVSALATPLTFKFGCKVAGDYDGSYVVSNYNGASWAVTVTGSGITTTYTVAPSWNTVKANNLLGYDPLGFAEVTEIRTVGDDQVSVNGTFFKLWDAAGSVGVWIDVNNAGTTIPVGAAACTRALEITTVTGNMTAAQIATVLAAALNTDVFTCTALGNLVTVTDPDLGNRTNATAETTSFTVSTWINGSLPNTLADVEYIDLMAEIEATANGAVISSQTFTVRLFHDVNQGGEGTATDATPAYPVPARIALNYYDVTGLTGGTAGKLDALATLSTFAVGTLLAVQVDDAPLLWRLRQLVITGATVAASSVVTTSTAHGLTSGQTAAIGGSNTTPTIDGNRVVTVLSSTTFTVPVTVTVAGTAGYTTPAEDTAAGLVRPADFNSATNPVFWQSRL